MDSIEAMLGNMVYQSSRSSIDSIITITLYYFFSAVAYGKGVYFAQDARYSASDTYSPPNYRGHKHIYYARVLTGEYTCGSSMMLEPPLKDQYDESGSRYDSLVNNIVNPSIFVIFNDAAFYPEYLIVFTLLY